jgi:hypothetical protein
MSNNIIAFRTMLWSARHCSNGRLPPRTDRCPHRRGFRAALAPRDRTMNHYNIIAFLAIAPFLVVAVTLWFA